MAVNRGKDFEKVIQKCIERVKGVSIDRLHDQTNGFAGSKNPCDFIVYKKPYLYYIECKTVHGNTLSIHSNDEKHKYGNITNYQWEELLKKSKIDGVIAGIICWWVDKDITRFIPIQALECLRTLWDEKSVRFDTEVVYDGLSDTYTLPIIEGDKLRVYYDYDMNEFFHDIEKEKKKKGETA